MSETQSLPEPVDAGAKLRQLLQEDTTGIHPRLHLAGMLARLMPTGYAGTQRAAVLRKLGLDLGPGTVVQGMPRLNGAAGFFRNLRVGAECTIGTDCTFDLEERITIGAGAMIGHQAMLLTSSHEIGPKEHRAGAIVRAPVTIGTGAWIGPRAIVLPGVTVGEGAVVTAGALVNKDVPPHTRVAGAPAKVVEEFAPQID